jgi:hypothetical protein
LPLAPLPPASLLYCATGAIPARGCSLPRAPPTLTPIRIEPLFVFDFFGQHRAPSRLCSSAKGQANKLLSLPLILAFGFASAFKGAVTAGCPRLVPRPPCSKNGAPRPPFYSWWPPFGPPPPVSRATAMVRRMSHPGRCVGEDVAVVGLGRPHRPLRSRLAGQIRPIGRIDLFFEFSILSIPEMCPNFKNTYKIV